MVQLFHALFGMCARGFGLPVRMAKNGEPSIGLADFFPARARTDAQPLMVNGRDRRFPPLERIRRTRTRRVPIQISPLNHRHATVYFECGKRIAS